MASAEPRGPKPAREDAPMSQNDAEKAVLAAEDRRYQAMINADLAALDELCADELSYAHSSGARDTKSEYLEKVRSGYYVYQRIDHPVDRVEVVGDAAIVVGRMTADLLVQGTPKSIDNLALAVWTRSSGDWRLLASAPAAPPPLPPWAAVPTVSRPGRRSRRSADGSTVHPPIDDDVDDRDRECGDD